MLGEARRRATTYMQCTVIVQGQPSEALLFPCLVEDRGAGGGAMSYADFLVQLHRQVSQSQVTPSVQTTKQQTTTLGLNASTTLDSSNF